MAPEPTPVRLAGVTAESDGPTFGKFGVMHRLLAGAGSAESIELTQFVRAVCEDLVGSVVLSDQSQFPSTSRRKATCMPIWPCRSTNSLKHARPTGVAGLLHVSCHRGDDGAAVIKVVGDGIGLPENFNVETDGGMGLKLIRALSRQIKAEFALNNRPIGLQFRLIVPLARRTRDGQAAVDAPAPG